jgi:hypothetical protein
MMCSEGPDVLADSGAPSWAVVPGAVEDFGADAPALSRSVSRNGPAAREFGLVERDISEENWSPKPEVWGSSPPCPVGSREQKVHCVCGRFGV